MNRKQRHFWMAQIGGWSLAAIMNILINQLIQPYPGLAKGSVLAMVLGCLVTCLYREVIHQTDWRQRSPRALIWPILWSTPVVSAVWGISFAIFVLLFGPLIGLPPAHPVNYFLGVFVSGNLIILIWAASYFAYQYFSRFSQAEVEKWRLRAVAREAQLGALKAQINPHFMFNALNNIRALILEDPARSREMLTHLSDLLRFNFSTVEQQLVTLEREMDVVRSYLELVSIQYEQRLSVQITEDPNLRETLVPPMLIQLLVENAIKHGVARSPGGGRLRIEVMTTTPDRVCIRVKNTGTWAAGPSAEGRSGVGLYNIRERLRLLYEDRADFRIGGADGWVTATVVLPVEEMV